MQGFPLRRECCWCWKRRGNKSLVSKRLQYLHALSQISCPLKLGAHISHSLPRAVSKLIDPRLIGEHAFRAVWQRKTKRCGAKLSTTFPDVCLCPLFNWSVTDGKELNKERGQIHPGIRCNFENFESPLESWMSGSVTAFHAHPPSVTLLAAMSNLSGGQRKACLWIINCLCPLCFRWGGSDRAWLFGREVWKSVFKTWEDRGVS